MTHKAARRPFLARNPFPNPLTMGFFYREKMRAIHRVAPDLPLGEILEVGGGQSGLTGLLYPNAHTTNLDMNGAYADAAPNRRPNITFICGDATALPFSDAGFDAVTMFDLIEHVADDEKAIEEAKRVLRPGGVLLISTPHVRWRYPYYGFMKPFGPPEHALFEEWGHVRRGYTLSRLNEMIDWPPAAWATFINPVTVICHDVAFSHLRYRRKLCALLAPLTWTAYLIHHPHLPGMELAASWHAPT